MMARASGGFSAQKLAEWRRHYPAEAKWLEAFTRGDGPGVPIRDEDSWRLYALSRVLDVINLTFQRDEVDEWPGPGLSADEASSFARDLGLTVTCPELYSAIDCEIVAVESADDPCEAARVVDAHWPSVTLGDMIVCRAGVTVRAGAAVVNPAVAPSSMLYWAYRRRHRPHQDLSHGWGNNSQWRTRFRRDYRVGTQLFYNVDGRCDLSSEDLVLDDDCPLTRSERTELLTNRCFIVTTKPSDDLWPYDDRVTLGG
jgi:hypothetical protein